jgi:hypothetical protein
MFVERKVRYSALFTNLVGWHASAVSFPLSDVILLQLACPLSDIMFCLHSRTTNLSLYKHWLECIEWVKELHSGRHQPYSQILGYPSKANPEAVNGQTLADRTSPGPSFQL